jgi:TonB family protein
MQFTLPLFRTDCRLPEILNVLLLFLLVSTRALPSAAQQSELDALARQVAQDVAVSSRPLFGSPALSKPGSSKTALIVTDFGTLHGSASQLGVVLADQFAQAFETQVRDAILLSRDCLHQLVDREGIVADDLRDFFALAWLGKKCGADLVIAGAADDTGNHLVLTIQLLRATDGGRVQQRRTTLEKTPEMVALLAQPPHSAASPPVETGIPKAGEQGIGEPACRICPAPSFTDDLNKGMKDKPLVLTFRVVVDQNGEVSDIAVVRGAPYGATDQAIETIRKWKLEPAKNADGRPVKAWTEVEVTFRHL